MRPVVCMVTAPAAGPDGDDRIVRRIEAAVRAGVHLVQIRQPHREALALVRLVERAVRAAAGTASRILVNERTDVALAAGAHGVHLRGDSMAASRIRGLVPYGFVIGRSVHSSDEAIAAERDGGVDYLLFGTVFATSSKPGLVAPAGLPGLAAACRAVALPVLAIGGISPSTAAPIAQSGAAGFAAIGLFADGPPDSIPDRVRHASSAFDTTQAGS